MDGSDHRQSGSGRQSFKTFVIHLVVLLSSSLIQRAVASFDDNGGDWLVDCRKQGYDPWQLACQTCSLLPPDHVGNCLACCQAYKDTERIRKPYAEAVLVIHRQPSPDGELHQFLSQDWDGLVASKGSRLSKTEQLVQIQHLQFAFFHIPSATLLFFDKPRTGSDATDFDTMMEHAKEVIRLDGWKRDDMRDMLKALLP